MLTPNFLLITLLVISPLAYAAQEQDKTDRELEEEAKTSYTFRRVLNGQIDVKVSNGIATLTGRVHDMDQSRLAEDTVAGMAGVKRVDNQIKVDPQARNVSDEWLAVKIRSKLLLKPEISLTHTRVDVKHGIVTLTGTAESESQKALTESAIKAIGGVRQVRNMLAIGERPADAAENNTVVAAEERLPAGAGLPTGRDTGARAEATPLFLGSKANPSPQRVEDAAITTQIKFELLTNRSTRGLETKVDTDAGRVIITGEAESDAQKELVTKLAANIGGVVAVDNRMTVKAQ